MQAVYAEQMDAEGLARKLLLTPPCRPPTTPEKQTVGKGVWVTSGSLFPKPAASIFTL